MNESQANDPSVPVTPADETITPESQANNVQNSEAAENIGSQVEGDLYELTSRFEKLEAEKDQIHDQLVRTMADFQNFRKRTQQETQMNRQYATESVIMSVLPVMDNFERTVKAAEAGATMESLLNGVRAVEKQLRFLVENQGVKRIESLGLPFDANIHEAIAMEPRADLEADTIIAEIEPGYKMGDKVIRPARVKVSTKP